MSTEFGDMNASCVFSNHCSCSIGDGFKCEGAADGSGSECAALAISSAASMENRRGSMAEPMPYGRFPVKFSAPAKSAAPGTSPQEPALTHWDSIRRAPCGHGRIAAACSRARPQGARIHGQFRGHDQLRQALHRTSVRTSIGTSGRPRALCAAGRMACAPPLGRPSPAPPRPRRRGASRSLSRRPSPPADRHPLPRQPARVRRARAAAHAGPLPRPAGRLGDAGPRPARGRHRSRRHPGRHPGGAAAGRGRAPRVGGGFDIVVESELD